MNTISQPYSALLAAMHRPLSASDRASLETRLLTLQAKKDVLSALALEPTSPDDLANVKRSGADIDREINLICSLLEDKNENS